MALQVAAREGDVELVKLLASNARGTVKARSDNGFTALHFAATEGHEQCARALLENGATVDAEDDLGATSLHYAIMKCATHRSIYLLAHPPSIQLFCSLIRFVLNSFSTASSYLHLYCTSSCNVHCSAQTEVVKLLLSRGADPRKKMNQQTTPMDIALEFEAPPQIQQMLKAALEKSATAL